MQTLKDPIKTKLLVLNGDVFDSWDFRRLCKQQWRVLSSLRSLSGKIQIVWINGNHDGPSELISHLLGIEVFEEFVVESGGRRIMVLHGHRFDTFISAHPVITVMADYFYRFLQKIHVYWARSAKQYSKTFLRCSEKVERDSKEYARKKHCQMVCCGHTHLEAWRPGDIGYFNSGCWTELPCAYLTILNGEVRLEHFKAEDENTNSN